MNSNPYIAAIITASAAFIAAVIAQIISHWLTKRRENHKYYKEVYQKLYAPILFELYIYIDVRTAFRRSNDIKVGIDVDQVKQKIFTHISENLMFATPQVISALHNVRFYDYHLDLRGNKQIIYEIVLFWHMLDQLLKLNTNTKLFDSSNKKTLTNYSFHYLLWSSISELRGEDAYTILSYKHNLKIEKLTKRLYNNLKNILRKYYSGEKGIHVLKDAVEEVVTKLTNGSGEFSPHAKTYLERSKDF
ncbi:hypothetical protein [Paenibacillus radicis (ex Xue et al. 2023)]|uniref:Phage abortive infection protein n=1 Tax=Paenibacillus radicis (ex Xue et al. 2023) TaxID=2972489 RepID=A0ABT1YL61_9BACL|nr:hypothetical protein [Paenibacillus radicis (ex Xue et al. 2023)]MCR8633916.1 hypothetical protein [Paenibacillus radicis (ex Xue et al. 2023)]